MALPPYALALIVLACAAAALSACLWVRCGGLRCGPGRRRFVELRGLGHEPV